MSKPQALITGGSSGIGLALSELLLRKGYHVHSVSRNPDRGPESASFTPLVFDLFEIERVTKFAQEFLLEYGVPDLLINNAGFGAFYEWASFPEDQILNQINLLFTAPVLLIREIAPSMAEQGRGIILNLSSLATLYPLPYMPLYNAGKSALSSFTQTMMLEYPKNPRFIDFRMGDVKTDFNRSSAREAEVGGFTNLSRTWAQIERQLEGSIASHTAAEQVYKSIEDCRSGICWGGSFFHRDILPLVYRLLPSQALQFFIRKWYSIYFRS